MISMPTQRGQGAPDQNEKLESFLHSVGSSAGVLNGHKVILPVVQGEHAEM